MGRYLADVLLLKTAGQETWLLMSEILTVPVKSTTIALTAVRVVGQTLDAPLTTSGLLAQRTAGVRVGVGYIQDVTNVWRIVIPKHVQSCIAVGGVEEVVTATSCIIVCWRRDSHAISVGGCSRFGHSRGNGNL